MMQFLERENAPHLAYIATSATEESAKLPTVMFLGGFRSDMEGTKATYFEAQCKSRGQAYIRFDYRGHGSAKGKFEEACIGEWAQDAIDILDHCTSGPVLLVGSSMGGWISLLVAQQRAERICGIVGLAAAPDFTTWMEDAMSAEQKQELENKGFFELPNDYDAPYIITKKLIEDGRNNALLGNEININVPVRLVQGKKDADVPWETAGRIKDALTSDDVDVILIEDADHRLSSPNQLALTDEVISTLSKT